MACVDSTLLYAANPSDGHITSIHLEKNGIGLKCVRQEVISAYDEGWNHVHSLCLKGKSLCMK